MSDAGSEQTLSEDNNHIVNENANTDPNNASFTIDDVVHYGELYDKCVHKNNMNNEIYEKYFQIFANRATKKFSNDVSPYGKKRISWMTLYEKVIRKIISPFNYKNTDKDYVTLHEIENRINIVINNEGINRRMKALYTKESGNFIPKIMKMFTYEKNNTAKKEIEQTIENSAAQKKMNYFPFTRRRMTSFKAKSNSSNNLLSILHSFRQDDKNVNKDNKHSPNCSNNNIANNGGTSNVNTNVNVNGSNGNPAPPQQNVSSSVSNGPTSQNRKRVYSLHKFMSVNLDSLQRAYDNHNNSSIHAARQRSSFDKMDKTSISASSKDKDKDKDKEIKTHLRQTLQPHSSLLKENSLQGIAEANTTECNNKNETNTMQQQQTPNIDQQQQQSPNIDQQQQQSPNTVQQQQQSSNTISKDSPINPLPHKHHSPSRHISMNSMPHYKTTHRNRTNSSKMLLGSRFNKKITPFTNNPMNNNNNNNNNSSSAVSKENKVPYDPYKIFRQIPKLDYKNYIGNSLYKQMDKLAYKDEISFFKRNTSPIGGSNSLLGGDDQDSNINNIHEKNMNYIFELINFEEENALNNIDSENDVQIRGDRIASYKQMADDIYNILIMEGNN